MLNENEKLILKNIQDDLLKYFKINKHKGIDWSSITFGEKYLKYINSGNYFIKRIKSSIVARSFNFFGHNMQFVFEPIEKQYFTKAICLYLMAKLNMNRSLNCEDLTLLEYLEDKKIQNSNLYAHDVNYNIMGASITKETPNLVTSYFVAELYFRLFLITSNDEYKHIFKLIIEELLVKIPYYTKSEDELCFQYTPVSNYNVHNANLLFCELLVKYNNLFQDDKQCVENNRLIQHSLNYSLNDFKKTNNYFYAGEETRNTSIDNYHTGYVLRSLFEIQKYSLHLDNHQLDSEISTLLLFYIDTFVKQGKYVYKFKKKIIESHSLAESIIVYSVFHDNINENIRKKFLKKIFNSIDILYDGVEKKFCNKVITFRGLPIRKDKMDYIRWSQAWMFFSISAILNEETVNAP